MNCFFQSQKKTPSRPSSTFELGLFIFILPLLVCKRDMSLFLVSLVRGKASEVSESTRVNFKPGWCLSDAVNDKENPRKLNPGCHSPSIRSTSHERQERRLGNVPVLGLPAFSYIQRFLLY